MVLKITQRNNTMYSTARIGIITLAATLTMLFTVACTQTPPVPVDELWSNATYSDANDIRATYDNIRSQIGKKDKESAIRNKCHLIWWGGEYALKSKGQNDDLHQLAEIVDTLSFDNATVQDFVQTRDITRFADHYFMLRAMGRGECFDAARDGLTVTVFFPVRPINSNDYTKLREVFSYKNNELHSAFLEKLKFPFRNSGCTKGLYDILPLIESNVCESPLKNEILELYRKYIPIMDGAKAPQAQLQDTKGNIRTLEEFKGKMLIIDVWATWCSSCLAKMPEYMKIRDKFAGNSSIEFITLSIDRNKKRNLWIETLKKQSMDGMTNLITGCDEFSEFEERYNIAGIPRYIIIDKEGYIITAYAPSPGDRLQEIIIENINK